MYVQWCHARTRQSVYLGDIILRDKTILTSPLSLNMIILKDSDASEWSFINYMLSSEVRGSQS